ncbi:armadillo-type protein [Dipodascopsis uninucleata]
MEGFNLSESLTAYLADARSLASSDLSGLHYEDTIDNITDAIAANSSAIGESSDFDLLQGMLMNFDILSERCKEKLVDLLISGLAAQTETARILIDNDEQESFEQQKVLLEMYSFLVQWAIASLEKCISQQTTQQASKSRLKGNKQPNYPTQNGNLELEVITEYFYTALDNFCKVQKLKLSKLFITTSERDMFVGMFTRPCYLLLESEKNVKNTKLKMHIFKVLCMAVKHHGHAFGAQTSLIQCLTYCEHMSEAVAEFLQILYEQYDHSQLSDDILRELSNKEFNSNDTKGPKSVSAFFIKLSEICPRLVIKQMTLLSKHLDCESYTLRCAVIEVCGNLIWDLSKQEDTMDNYKSQINSFFDVLIERFLDINPYCRSKTLQSLTKLCDLETKFPQRRQRITDLAIQSLQDKSSNVRRNAIKLLSKLMSTHPFDVLHGSQLPLREWKERMEKVTKELNQILPPLEDGSPGHNPGDLSRIDDNLLDSPSDNEDDQDSNDETATIKPADNSGIIDPELINRLKLTKQYYSEAITFIESLQSASDIICSLLSAKNKIEVIEAMDFFVLADIYQLETAKTGIRKMIHLIWTKANSDEGKGVQNHLIECYKSLFFTAPDNFSENDTCTFIARNLISLTYGATAAELTSLERLLYVIMKNKQMPELVIQKLWQVYGVQQRDISKSQRRGAIIVLGMLAVFDSNIVAKELETLFHVGLGALGKNDLVLARYTCVALQRMSGTSKRLPNDQPVVNKLMMIICMYSGNQEWFALAEQAIKAVYMISKRPDLLCAEAIRQKTKLVFFNSAVSSSEELNKSISTTTALAQLLFMVGQIAIEQLVYMENIENEFKRRKAASEKDRSNISKDEMELISGTSEDDFTEAMSHIRERELLFSDSALLSRFGGLVSEICSDNLKYNNAQLQTSATLCLAKFMCVSSIYCEKNLPLLLTILEKSKNPITRSNIVIALGDMAVCFNHLIDENTDFFYRRLHDKDSTVQRTCLMTLTFLILAGQVKVKGQLGEMAKCLEYEDKKIADLAKMFFTELAHKDNAIYNAFTDIFSTLSADEFLEEESFRRIIKFLLSFIEKEKHAKQLHEKLSARLPRCDTERQRNDVNFALSLLPHKA